MKKTLSIISLLFGILSSNEPSDPGASSSLASTEGLLSSIIGGHVSVITGDLLFNECDLALPGPKPLRIERHYCSGDNAGGQLYKSWWLSEPTPICYYQPDPKKTGTALVTTPHGARAKFEVSLRHKPVGKTAFEFVDFSLLRIRPLFQMA